MPLSVTELRTARQWQRAARRAGINPAIVVRAEGAQPIRINTLARLAGAFNGPVARMLARRSLCLPPCLPERDVITLGLPEGRDTRTVLRWARYFDQADNSGVTYIEILILYCLEQMWHCCARASAP